MFSRENGPTALRADLVRGLSLSSCPAEVRTDGGAGRAVAGVASVWNGSRGFVAVVVRFLEPPRVERYMYAQPLPDEAAVEAAEVDALEFARGLGFDMDAPAFAELDEAARRSRLQNWDRIRKVREAAEAGAGQAGSGSAAPPETLAGDPEVTAELAAEDLEEPLELEPLEEGPPEAAAPPPEEPQAAARPPEPPPAEAPAEPIDDDDATPISLQVLPGRAEDDTPLELTTLGGAPSETDPGERSDDTPIEVTSMLESSLPGDAGDGEEGEGEATSGFIPIGLSSPDLRASLEVELEEAQLDGGDEDSGAGPTTIQLTDALSSDLMDTASSRAPRGAAPEGAEVTGGAVIGRIPLVRKEGADRRRLSALGRLLSFF